MGVDAKLAGKISQMPLKAKPQLPATGIFGKLVEMGALAKK